MATVSDLYKKYKVSKSTIYRWLKQGKIEGKKVGRSWNVTSDTVSAWGKRMRSGTSGVVSATQPKKTQAGAMSTGVTTASTSGSGKRFAVGDVATRYKVSKSTIYRWLKTGKLEGAKEGRYWYVTGKSESGPVAPKGTAIKPISTQQGVIVRPAGVGTARSLQERGFDAPLLSRAGTFGISHEMIGKQTYWTPEFVTKGIDWGMKPSGTQGRSYWNAPEGMSAERAFEAATGKKLWYPPGAEEKPEYVEEKPLGGYDSGPVPPTVVLDDRAIPPGGGQKSGPVDPTTVLDDRAIPPGGGQTSGPAGAEVLKGLNDKELFKAFTGYSKVPGPRDFEYENRLVGELTRRGGASGAGLLQMFEQKGMGTFGLPDEGGWAGNR